MPFLDADDVEDEVIKHYAVIQLDAGLVEETKRQLEERLERQRKQMLRSVKRQEPRLSRLSHERAKLLHAYYKGLLSDDELFKAEQARISREIEEVNYVLAAKNFEVAEAEELITMALDMVPNIQAAYKRSPDEVRRKSNHTFFERIIVDADGVRRSELTEGFAAIAAQAFATQYEKEMPEPVFLGRRPGLFAQRRVRSGWLSWGAGAPLGRRISGPNRTTWRRHR